MTAYPFLNDRQAFDAMQQYIDVVGEWTLDGYDISGAIRHPFFASCIASHEYAERPMAALKGLLIPALTFTAADILIVREGTSKREDEQIFPLQSQLASMGYQTEVAHPAPVEIGLSTFFAALRALNYLPAFWSAYHSAPARELIRAFGLTQRFKAWFACQAVLARYRFDACLRALKSAAPRPQVVIVFSEYHALSRPMLSAAQQLGIPTVLVQHGFLGQHWLHHPVMADRVCVFGEVERHWYVARGTAADRIAVTGSNRAFSVDPNVRSRQRAAYGLAPQQRAIVFFAPNLSLDYHRDAARFLQQVRKQGGENDRWLLRPHPAQASDLVTIYPDFIPIPGLLSFEEVCALADVVVHSYSTMAFAEFAGLKTVCLELDPPYPPDYGQLIGQQPRISSPDDFARLLARTVTPEPPVSHATETMAAGGTTALNNLANVIVQLFRSNSAAL